MDAHPTLDQLQVFLTVVEEGSFSGASRKLNRAQSVVSYTIANLEAQLQLPLFERAGTRQPKLTDAGAILVEDARRIVSDLQLLRARVRGLGQGLEGQIRLAVDVLVPIPVLTATLHALREAYPSVGVRLYTGALGAVPNLVLGGEADIGIAGELVASHPDLVSRKVGQDQNVPVAAPSHPLAREAASVPTAIVNEHFQIVISDLTPQTQGQNFRVHAFNTWRVSDLSTKHALILAGLGWGGLPLWRVADDIRSGHLVKLSLEPYPPSDYSLFAIRAAERPYGPATTWLADRFEIEFEAFGSGRH